MTTLVERVYGSGRTVSYRSCITRKVISLGEIGRGEEEGAGLKQEVGSPRSDVGRQGRSRENPAPGEANGRRDRHPASSP
jgi:hypothetical protein